MFTKVIVHSRKGKTGKQFHTVSVFYSYKYEKMYYSTGITLERPDQLRKEQVVRTVENADEKNIRIKLIRGRIEREIERYVSENRGENPSVVYVRKAILGKLPELSKDDVLPAKTHIASILGFYEDFLAEQLNLRKPGTGRTYHVLQHNVEEFFHKYSIKHPEDIGRSTLKNFEIFLNKTKGYHNATTAKRISQLKTFLRWVANEKNISISFHALNYKSSTTKRNSETIVVLTKEDLNLLSSAELTNPLEDKIRDVMVFLCMTGLRISDCTKVNKYMVKNNVLIFHSEKTGERCEIPLNTRALAILQKYNYSMGVNEIYFNRIIKEICLRHEICSEPVQVDSIRENQITYEVVPKYTLISSKTGRKTFISELVRAGVPISQIMRSTGHRQLQIIRHYMQIFGSQENGYTKALDF